MMIAELPSTWAAVPLSAVCEINPRTKSELKSADLVSFVPMAAVSEHSGIIVASETRPLEEVRKGFTPFQDGDVLFAKITPCMENGKTAIARGLVNGQGYGSTEFHVLRPSSLVMAEWLFAIIRTKEFRRAAAASFQGAVGQQRVTADFIQRFRIPLPPLSEQQRIVDILQESEEIRRLRAQAEAKTAELISAIFHDRFVRDQAHEYQPLHKLAEVVSGVAIGRKSRGMAIEVPYVRVANVQAGYIDLTEIKTTPATENEIEQFALHNGDVLLTEGGDFDKLGRGALWEGQVSPCIHQNHVFRVRPNREKLLARFFAHYLQSAKAKGYFLRCAKKTTNLASINLTQLMALPVPVVSLEEQEAFEAEIEAASKTVSIEGERLFSALSRSLSAHAFTGQLTEEWRENHQKKLASEARDRDAALQQAGVAHPLFRRATIPDMDRIWNEPTDGIYSDLNREQRALLSVIQRRGEEPTPYLTAVELSTRVDGSLPKNPQAIESHLAVFAARGILIPVSREEHPPDTTLYVFGNAYRLPLEDRNDSLTTEEGVAFITEEGEPFVSETILGERRRVHELGRLVGRLERENRMS